MATVASMQVKNGNPIETLREFTANLLADEDVAAVLVNRHMPGGGSAMPAMVTDPAQLAHADPLAPSFAMNGARIAARLTKGEMEGRIAAIMRPCEVRAFVELVKLNQGEMENILLISFDCFGAFDNRTYKEWVKDKDPEAASLAFTLSGGNSNGVKKARACLACEHPAPDAADIQLGLAGVDTSEKILVIPRSARGEGLVRRLGLSDDSGGGKRQEALDKLIAERMEYRDAMFAETDEAVNSLEKLGNWLSGCVNCYNCRAACPVCYCRECVFLTDVFDHKPWQYLNWAKQRGSLKMPVDTAFFHLTRLAHMSTACVGCGQCSNACPNDVPVMELFRTVSARTQDAFEYHPGKDPAERPPMSVFQEQEFAEMTQQV